MVEGFDFIVIVKDGRPEAKSEDFFCKIQITLFKYLKLALTIALRKEKFFEAQCCLVWKQV